MMRAEPDPALASIPSTATTATLIALQVAWSRVHYSGQGRCRYWMPRRVSWSRQQASREALIQRFRARSSEISRDQTAKVRRRLNHD